MVFHGIIIPTSTVAIMSIHVSYSTSLEHNVTLKTSMHIFIACCVSVLFLQTSACWLLDQRHTLTTLVLYLEHQLIPPHSVLFPITAVSPPPHTPGPARKWLTYVCVFVSLCVHLCSVFLYHERYYIQESGSTL